DAVMREFVYQKNQEFFRRLHVDLTHFLVARTADMLAQGGRVAKPVQPVDLMRVAGSAAEHSSVHLEMSLATEDILQIARHTAAQLHALGFLEDETLEYRPGALLRPGLAIGRWLGREPPTFIAEMEQLARRERDRLWAIHIHGLNDEILDRAGKTF